MPDIQPPVVDNSANAPMTPPTGSAEEYATINPVDASRSASKPLSSLVYGFIAGMAIMVLSTGGLYLYDYIINKNNSKLLATNNDIKKELSSGQYATAEKEISDLKAEVTNFKAVVGAQVDFSRLFQVLKSSTYSKAKYTTFAYSKDNKISISGTTDTYTDLGKFLKSFPSSPQISNFVLGTFSGSGSGGKGVQFSASFQYVVPTTAASSATPTSSTSAGTTPTTNQGGQ